MRIAKPCGILRNDNEIVNEVSSVSIDDDDAFGEGLPRPIAAL
jgi:hypothetical protein